MSMDELFERNEEKIQEVDLLEDFGWGAIGSHSIVSDAEEILKLTDKDIAHVYRYGELLEEMNFSKDSNLYKPNF